MLKILQINDLDYLNRDRNNNTIIIYYEINNNISSSHKKNIIILSFFEEDRKYTELFFVIPFLKIIIKTILCKITYRKIFIKEIKNNKNIIVK